DDFVIRVSWDAVVHAESYDVYRSSNSSSGFTKVAEGVTATVWNDATPLAGNNYYRIYAVGHGLTSPVSNTTTVINYVLDAPTNVAATYDGNTKTITVSWNSVPHAVNYDVYRNGILLAENVAGTSCVDNSLGLGPTTYYVKAKNHGVVSEASESTYIFIHANDEAIEVTVNGVDIYMVKVTGGTFQMGATAEQGTVEWRDYYGNERPVHQVTLSDYYIGETEVTQELWQAVMGSNPSYFKTSNQLPVECVSWNDCQTFITNLNQLTGKQFRLPTEAEWEYAARSGNMSQGYKYSGSNDIGEVAWWAGNSDDKTHAVGTMSPNELGIFDMSGNVLEFCQDWYGSYSSSEQTNPTGPSSGSQRVKRGGCWMNLEVGCRVSYRDVIESDNGNFTLGLRLAL
ncbi:MAG: SUMF1/EgtB/PvdO family nonheme iron enzyme, partial [Prevotella sp.]|nr:SUMF1/EgtB/PvdO family nonheme iron enzyme [Prevotella sp.]